jgi:hypothetical protein
MILFWIIFGPLILLYSLAKDMFYYIKLFERITNKIVIYNEVIDVMRSIVHIYRKKMNEAKMKRQALGEFFWNISGNTLYRGLEALQAWQHGKLIQKSNS